MTMQAKLMKRVWTGFLRIGERYVLFVAHSDLKSLRISSPKLKTRKEYKWNNAILC